MNELTQRGIKALRSGDRSTARLLLGAALKQDPNDATAWLWLTGTLDSDEERIQCLQQVLRIDPGNEAAARGLAQILERRAKKPSTPETTPEAPAAQLDGPVTVSEGTGTVAEVPGSVAEVPSSRAEVPANQGGGVASEASAPGSVTNVPATIAEVPANKNDVPGSTAEGPTNEAEGSGSVAETPAEVVEVASTVVDVASTEVDQPASETNIPGTRVDDLASVTHMPGTEVETPATVAKARRARSAAETGQVIFRTRPSIVPALLGFWTFLLGAVAVGVLLRENMVLSLTLGIGLVIFLQLIFIYVLMRNMSTRYELTDQNLLLRFRGSRVRVPHQDIYSAECRQNKFQQVLGTGDIYLRAAVRGELSELRIRNIPECSERTRQIQAIIQPEA